MDEAGFSIAVDPVRRFVDIAVRGLWGVDMVAAYKDDLVAKLHVLPGHGCPIGQHVTLLDITAFVVQPQQVTALLADMPQQPAFAARRAALLVEAPLLKMQAKRVLPTYLVCSSRAEALEWLLAPDGVPIADLADHSA